jgi:hypothetical protein
VSRITIRDLHGLSHDTEVLQEGGQPRSKPLIVHVAGFGALAAQLVASDEPIVRLGEPELFAGLYNNEQLKRRNARRVDGGWEVELLPNSSGEDRIVVCIPNERLT